MCTVVFMKESDTSHQSVKNKFLNEPKQTELTKQKHGVNMMHTNICVAFDMSFATPQSTALLYFFFEKNFSIEHSI